MCIFQWAMARAKWSSTIKFRAKFPVDVTRQSHIWGIRDAWDDDQTWQTSWQTSTFKSDFLWDLKATVWMLLDVNQILHWRKSPLSSSKLQWLFPTGDSPMVPWFPWSEVSAERRQSGKKGTGPDIRLHQRCRSGMIRFHTNFTKVPIIYIYNNIRIITIIICNKSSA